MPIDPQNVPDTCPICEEELSRTEAKNGTITLECRHPFPKEGVPAHTLQLMIFDRD